MSLQQEVTRQADVIQALERHITWMQQVGTEQVERYRALEVAYRKLLWVTHGCSGLYGDDGEMQCNQGTFHRPLDFRRDSIQTLEIAVLEAKMRRQFAGDPQIGG